MTALLAVCLTTLAYLAPSFAFLYIPSEGQIWDPSVTYWDGRFYVHAMYQLPKDPTNRYAAGWLATSSDGAHWDDGGKIAPEHPGDGWWKGFVRQVRADPKPLFVMDHGVLEPGKGNDALRFLSSTDLKHWTEISTSHPDQRWYNTRGRWDHMYMSEDNETGGYVGFAVSSPTLPGFPQTWPAVLRSENGVKYNVHEPLNVTWNGVGLTSIEEGGFERLEGGGKYYLIGGGGGHGHGYSMWVFQSEHIAGPYEPLKDGFLLSTGFHLAAWCRGPGGERLFSDYFSPNSKDPRAEVWLLPLRKAALDGGRLRMAYWEGNDKLQGQLKKTTENLKIVCGTTSEGSEHQVAWLADFDSSEHKTGVVLRGKLAATGGVHKGSVGFALEDMNDIRNGTSSGLGHTAVLMELGVDGAVEDDFMTRVMHYDNRWRAKEIYRATSFECGDHRNQTKCGTAMVTAVEPGTEKEFIVLFRRGMFEIYLGGYYVQTSTYGGQYPFPNYGAARIGIACDGVSAATVTDVHAFEMSLSTTLVV